MKRAALQRLRRPINKARAILRWLLAAAFLAAGYFHLALPEPFIRIMPPWVPMPRATVIVTGVCELFGAVGLLIPRMRRIAGVMLALYAVCVYPANVQHAFLFAQSGKVWTGWLYHGPRLLFQPVVVWWCLFAGTVIDWPFTATGRADLPRTRRPRAPKA